MAHFLQEVNCTAKVVYSVVSFRYSVLHSLFIILFMVSFNIPLLIIVAFLLLKSTFVKEKLAKLKPSDATIGCTGCYVILTTVLDYIIGGLIYWYIFQFTVGIWLIGYAIASKNEVPSWKIGLNWLLGVLFCLPVNLLWHWWHVTDPSFALTLSVAHLAITLFVLPLYLSIKLVVVILFVIIYALYSIGMPLLLPLADFLLSLLGFSLLAFAIIIYSKRKLAAYRHYSCYLRKKARLQQEKEHKLKLNQIAHSLHINPLTTRSYSEEDSAFLEKVMEDVMESTASLEDSPLYKEDFQSIINKFVSWDIFLKQQTKSKAHILLLPTEITLDKLIQKLELALKAEGESAPKLVIEQKDGVMPAKIVCDVNQVIHLLLAVVLRTANLDHLKDQSVTIQLHATRLKYKKYGPIKNERPPEIAFPAIALVVRNAATPLATLPPIKYYYEDITEGKEFIWGSSRIASEDINFEKQVVERMVRAHYGYLQFPSSKQKVMLLVLPCNVTHIRDQMIANLIASDVSITPKKVKESIEMLVKCNEYVCKIADVRVGVMDELFLLLRRCYGFRRHVSGQLFYLRAAGITQLVADWIPRFLEPIYATLLYDLVRYTRLPFSYIKANYDLDIFCFVQRILSIHKRQDIEPSGLYLDNHVKTVINQEQLAVLCIKLAERLYDLRHVEGYSYQSEVSHMAKETLTIDVRLAKKYLNNEIAEALTTAAQRALEICKEKW